MDDQGRLREVSWQELFPWLRIVSALRLAVSPSLLALGAIGIVATIAGWRFIAWAYDEEQFPWPWQQSIVAPSVYALDKTADAAYPLGNVVVGNPPPALYVPDEYGEIVSTPFIYAWNQLSDYGEL